MNWSPAAPPCLPLPRSPDSGVDIEIVNVNSHSLGIAGVDTHTKEKINKILIPRNTPLPAKVVRKFVTHRDNQRGVSVTLLEGENENPKYCEVVAKSSILAGSGIRQSGSDIELVCSYCIDGTIQVSARVVKDRKSAILQVKREMAQEMDSLSIWKARLLNQESGLEQFIVSDSRSSLCTARTDSNPESIIRGTRLPLPGTGQNRLCLDRYAQPDPHSPGGSTSYRRADVFQTGDRKSGTENRPAKKLRCRRQNLKEFFIGPNPN